MSQSEKPEELKFYLGLLLQIYQDAAKDLDPKPSSVRRDIITLTERVENQGLDFLTKSLPSLGKSLDKALASDAPFQAPSGFKLSKCRSHPLLFGGLWAKVFDLNGEILVSNDVVSNDTIQAVRAIRQVCYLFYKLEGCHSAQSEGAVIDKFIETDSLLPGKEDEVSLPYWVTEALENARILMHFVLKGIDLEDITPGHGPGAVSTGESASEKMFFKRIYGSLEKKYPFTDYFHLNYSHLVETLERLEQLEEVATGTAKVVLVPKDSRGPRLISMEPLELQWIQQGQMRKLVHQIEQVSNLTCGYVNFTSQDINRRLALSSSLNQEYVTLDMEEASDRVSHWLVRKLLPAGILDYLEASRSTHTLLPNGVRLELRKFAPMGSSICFPVEALIFWALAVGSLRRISGKGSLDSLPPVYVYGDDIIMRKHDYVSVRPVFEALFLRFNESKCCVGRFFRESCGEDAFVGVPVTPQRIRTRWSKHLSPAATISYVSYINNLRRAGYSTSADYICKSNIKAFGRLPEVSNTSYHSLALLANGLDTNTLRERLYSKFRTRYNPLLQRDEVRLLTPYSPTLTVGSPDWEELFRSILRMGSPDPFGVEKRTLPPCCYPVPRQIKTRWNWVAVSQLLS